MKLKHLFEKRRDTMFEKIFTTSVLSVVVLACVAIFTIVRFIYPYILQEKGNARVQVLQQISDSNTVNRKNMVNLMNSIDETLYDLLIKEPTTEGENEIQQKLTMISQSMDYVGMDFTVDILMNDKRVYSIKEDEVNIKNLRSTYWYIKHYSGEVAESWNLRFLSSGDTSDYGLSYGRTIYNTDEKAVGVIILTSEDESLFRTLKKLTSNDNKIYILDRNGIIISHTNPQMIGNWMANMETFEEKYAPYNSFSIVKHGKDNVILSDYHDSESGWTFVEEQRVDQLLTNVFHIIAICLFVVIAGSIFILVISYIRTKQISNVFEQFSKDIQNMQAHDLSKLPVRDQCEEAYVLSNAFNGMIQRISKLIVDIQKREQEKRKNEYDFLHAQLDPHFLNNTLVAVKSLIAMGEMERASKMMGELIELLHVPATPEIQFVPLKEELNLIQNFVSIMNCRTEKEVKLFCEIPEEYNSFPIPRMILQPIIGNTFFHGFAGKDEDCQIHITAEAKNALLMIHITDNGEGIEPLRLQEIRTGEYEAQDTHHGIGLKNIRKRLEIIYGGESRIEIHSELGQFTTVSLLIDNYQREMEEGLFS